MSHCDHGAKPNLRRRISGLRVAFARLARRVRHRTRAVRATTGVFLRRHISNESRHLFALTLVVGAACGLVAVAFHLAIRLAEHLMIDRAMHASGPAWMVWTVVTPTVGGLLAGAALTWIVPGARGSGIPQVKHAFATEGGRVRFRDALGKFIIGAFQIGSGASLGREGPTVQICAGAASLLARLTSLPPRNMRRLTPVGVAAGIAAAFNAPIAAVTFTIEELVGTLDQTVLSGVVVAAAIAAVIERGLLGTNPVIGVAQAYGLDHPSSLLLYAFLGVAAAFVAVAFTDGLVKLRLMFRRFHLVPAWMHPGVGGLVTGVLAVLVLRYLGTTGVTGGGYETLRRALGGELGLKVLLVLCAAKTVATVFSYSSGGAGGIFAPSLFIGAMLGGAVGHLDVVLLGHEHSQLGAFALVGMGAVFAGAIRVPITSVLIIFEMTGGYGLVLPLMLANMTSYVIARWLRPTPIYRALLEQDGIFLPDHEQPAQAAELLRVSDAMTAVLPGAPLPGQTICCNEPLLRALTRMNDSSARQLGVLDETGTNLVGSLAMSDVVRVYARTVRNRGSLPLAPSPSVTASDVMVRAELVAQSTRLPELLAPLRAGSARAFLVGDGTSSLCALLPEHCGLLPEDEEFEKMLIAADVAHPVVSVSATADLPALIQSFREGDRDAVAVLSASGEPVGLITRNALALAVLQWHAGQPTPGDGSDAS